MPHSWNPPPSLKEGEDLPKIESLGGGGVQNFLLERGHKPEKGAGVVDVEIRGVPIFYYFTVQSYLLCVGKVRFPLLLFGSSVF